MPMKKPKKTINVEWLKNYINEKLKMDVFSDAEKQGLCLILERVLFDTKNYQGFRWNNENEKHFSIVNHDVVWTEYHKKNEYDRHYF